MAKSWIFSCVLLLGVFEVRAAPQGGIVGTGAAGASPAIMIAPMPPFPGGGGVCVEDGATGFINDTCQTDADCYDSGSMTCSSKRCQCGPNYVEDPGLAKGSKQRTCAPTPSLLSPCTNVCQKPYECKKGTQAGSADAGIPVILSSSGQTCQCPGKSKYVNGVCDAGCKDGQRLGNGGQCVARCTKDQVLIDNECKKLAGLGESCTDNGQCSAAFSQCQNGKCACSTGFSAQGSKCVSKTYNCPFGDALKKGDSVVLCEGSSSPFPVCMGGICPMAAGAEGARGGGAPPQAAAPQVAAGGVSSMPFFAKPYKTDSCPSTHYCYNYDFAGPKARGHCCPKAPAKCPVGEPHPSAQCNGGQQSCPYNTHTCIAVGPPTDYSNQLCCPKPCQGFDKVLVKDQCLPVAQFGDSCQYNEQCQQFNGVCSGGKCTCGPKSEAIDAGVGMRYCQLKCDNDEIPYGSECKARLKLGDSCTAEGSFCPSGALCNKKGVCACACNHQKINEKFCAPPPYCPTSPTSPPQPAPGTDIKKFTFCKVDGGGKPPLTTVDSCQKKSFCSAYVENMGVCCPEPEPFCPDGSKPTSTRDCHNGEKGCGTNEYCNPYFYSLTTGPDGEPQQGSVCCPMSSDMPMPIPMGGPMAVPGNAGAGVAVSSAASGPRG